MQGFGLVLSTDRGTSVSAHDWIRTSTPIGTTPSRWHVYQFHHVGISTAKIQEAD